MPSAEFKDVDFNAEELLQRIYDSEINVLIGWNWDGGFSFVCGAGEVPDIFSSHNSEKVIHTGETDIFAALLCMAEHIENEYPESQFAIWYHQYHTV